MIAVDLMKHDDKIILFFLWHDYFAERKMNLTVQNLMYHR
jgi:hypothetical protein